MERLGPSIQGWEDDMLKHRFDWSDESMSALEEGAMKWLKAVNWAGATEERYQLLLGILAIKSKSSSNA